VVALDVLWLFFNNDFRLETFFKVSFFPQIIHRPCICGHGQHIVCDCVTVCVCDCVRGMWITSHSERMWGICCHEKAAVVYWHSGVKEVIVCVCVCVCVCVRHTCCCHFLVRNFLVVIVNNYCESCYTGRKACWKTCINNACFKIFNKLACQMFYGGRKYSKGHVHVLWWEILNVNNTFVCLHSQMYL